MPLAILLSLLIFCSFDLSAQSNNQSYPLFKSLSYGDQQSSFTAKDGYYDCEKKYGENLKKFGENLICNDDMQFAEHSFIGVLSFDDNKLNTVILITNFEENLMLKIPVILLKTMPVVMIEGKAEELDLLKLRKEESSDRKSYQQKFLEFAGRNRANGFVRFTHIEAPENELFQYNFVMEAIDALPTKTRFAEFIYGDEGAQPVLVLRFSYPKLDLRNLLKEMKEITEKPVEKF